MTKGALKLYVKPSQKLGLNNWSCIVSLMPALSLSLPYPGPQNVLFVLSTWQWKLCSAFYTTGWPDKKVPQDLINERERSFLYLFDLHSYFYSFTLSADSDSDCICTPQTSVCIPCYWYPEEMKNYTATEVAIYLEGRNLMVCSLRCQSKMQLTYQERPKLIGMPRTNLTCILSELGFYSKCGGSRVHL